MSCFRRCARILASVRSLTTAKSMSVFVSMAALYRRRPILPNPFIATFILLFHLLIERKSV